MSTTTDTPEIIIPRPGTEVSSPISSVLGSSEESFTSTFGKLLPRAQFLSTRYGKIAYYTYAPLASTSTSSSGSTVPSVPASPSGQKVLLLHGVQTPSLGLQPVAENLHSQFPQAEFVLVDLWGHGLSSTPLVAHTPSLFHSLISALLEHLQWSSCHLVGYSFGGATAISYLAAESHSNPTKTKIQSVSLIAPAGLWKSPGLDKKKLYSTDFGVAKAHVLDLLEGGPLIVPSDWESRVANGEIVAEKVREWQMQHHAAHTASVVAIVRDGGVFGLEEEYSKAAKLGVPVLAVLGENDDVVFEKDLRAVGVENVVVVKGAGHAVVRQKVDQVAGHIQEFWDGLQV
ncbi:alpha/beta-hydrolase, partial [Aureobasidium melanogenum]|uniref:Alpha/beta-hydrolase n=1 Tax=Aureobasidium melanogenum (strain CBS 110374) TaxID=1043003 RepID=A0A074VNA3_AURM1